MADLNSRVGLTSSITSSKYDNFALEISGVLMVLIFGSQCQFIPSFCGHWELRNGSPGGGCVMNTKPLSLPAPAFCFSVQAEPHGKIS